MPIREYKNLIYDWNSILIGDQEQHSLQLCAFATETYSAFLVLVDLVLDLNSKSLWLTFAIIDAKRCKAVALPLIKSFKMAVPCVGQR